MVVVPTVMFDLQRKVATELFKDAEVPRNLKH